MPSTAAALTTLPPFISKYVNKPTANVRVAINIAISLSSISLFLKVVKVTSIIEEEVIYPNEVITKLEED